MESFDLDTKLMQFGTGDDLSQNWCIKHSLTGVQAFGSNGSGKSSSLKTLAIKYLRAGYGFLILSAKSERATWEEYCQLAGRSSDFVRIGIDSPHRFDFMKYLSKSNTGAALTANLLNILKSVIQAGDDAKDGKSSDPFWVQSLSLLLYNSISLNQLAYGDVSVQRMYDIIQSAPHGGDDETGANASDDDAESAFNKAFEIVRTELAAQVNDWRDSWKQEEKLKFADKAVLEEEILKRFPKARPFKFVEQFFFQTFKTLSGKTKSIVLFSVSNFFFHLLQEPMYSLFCGGEVNITPDSCTNGAVILLDLPTEDFQDAGRSAQLLFKLIFMQQMRMRDITKNNRPVALWSDESQEFLLESDSSFQAVSRSKFIALVYITQNIHQYYSHLGGTKSVDRVKSFLGTMNTKIFFGNSCVSTNSYASELIGDEMFYDPSRTITIAEKFSQTDAVSLKIDRVVPNYKFIGLASGGSSNNCMVEAFIHVQGDRLFNGRNFKKIRFDQNYK